MGQIVPLSIAVPVGGMTSNKRLPDLRYAALVKGFDIYSKPYQAIPHRAKGSGNSIDIRQIVKFCYASSTLFGLGIGSSGSGTFATFWYKTALTDDLWTNIGSDATNDPTATTLFVEYKDYLYGAANGTRIWKVGPVTTPGATSFTTTERALTYTSITQGVVHPKDDRLYVGYTTSSGSFIAMNHAGSWTNIALTLPTNLIPTSVCAYGNFLSIACRPKYSGGKSRVFLWDRDSSLTTLTETIEWGEGDLILIEEVDGYLIGISKSNTNSFFAKLTFRSYISNAPQIFRELISSTSTAPELLDIQKAENKLYFMASITLDGTLYQGVWALTRNGNGFVLAFDHPPQTSALNSGVLKGFILIGDYCFEAFVSGGSYKVTKTDNTATYSTSTIETLVQGGHPFPDPSHTKKLLGVTLYFEPLPSGASVVLSYKKDEDTSWTQIFSHSTLNSLSHSAVNIESTGVTLPEYREIQFQIQSVGGAVFTGGKAHAEQLDKDIY